LISSVEAPFSTTGKSNIVFTIMAWRGMHC
jgi:hypothetical protein